MKGIRTFIIIIVAIAFTVVLILDGTAIYDSRGLAKDLSKDTADKAVQAYVSSRHNKDVAELAALAVVEGAKGKAEVVSLKFERGWNDYYALVTIRVLPDTLLVGKIPGLKNTLWQKDTYELRFN